MRVYKAEYPDYLPRLSLLHITRNKTINIAIRLLCRSEGFRFQAEKSSNDLTAHYIINMADNQLALCDGDVIIIRGHINKKTLGRNGTLGDEHPYAAVPSSNSR